MRQNMGASVPDQALAVPATPLRVDGPPGFDPARECNILDKTQQVCPRHGHSHAPNALATVIRRVVLDAHFAGYGEGYADGATMFGSSADGARLQRMAHDDYSFYASQIKAFEDRIAIAIEARQRTDPEEGLDPKDADHD